MELGSVFLILAVLIIVGVYLYAPFMSRTRHLSTDEMHEISALKAERDRIINSLQELDFDFKLGKIPAEDYPEQRAEMLKKGSDILRQLDELEPLISSSRDAQSRIERAAAAKRADSADVESDLNDEDVENMIAARRKQHKGKSAGFCPSCGKPILTIDNFCPSCGKSLK
ncbi:MAG: zinc-ribbon domain-containing protein [Anaerolineales bacterium]|nr:zinc-ribbon domain-containing protein [Anaerolineales bacterium]MCB9111963.1 zinc-ribbon domain-containing protein [Anaerolineales bacterium]